MSTSSLMPAAFFGHGNPMNALQSNRYTEAWKAFGASVPRPRAILMVSAHWYTTSTAVTAMARPKTIHDFYGFPHALSEIRYPAPGLPSLVDEVAEVARPDSVGADADGWGLDHGTWSVLLHAFPRADVPVVQLSINASRPADYHMAMGARLAALRKSGVLVMGSGNVVHNLRAMDRQAEDVGFDWARRFNEHAIEVVTRDPGNADRLVGHPDFARSTPTPDHFLPLLYLAGFAAAEHRRPALLVDGYAYGSLSMAAFGVDVPVPQPPAGLADTTALGSVLPPEATNI